MLTIADLLKMLPTARAVNINPLLDPLHLIPIYRIVIDSRKVQPGDVFVALKGPNFDGHDFAEAVKQAGASLLIVTRPLPCTLPQIVVRDTYACLIELARAYRAHFNIPLYGITGSCGKTTTKTLLAAICTQVAPTLATEGTLNNEIGLPLTLLRLQPEHRYAVIEMGANHVGEIAMLADIAKPTCAVITCVAPVHLEGFGSIERIAQAKAEIYSALSAAGTAVVNRDDAYASFFHQVIGARRTITFSQTQPADVYASDIQLDAMHRPSFMLHVGAESQRISLQLLGRHNIVNALAAAACAYAEAIPFQAICAGLTTAEAVAKRLVVKQASAGYTVIDDSYNANPTSVRAAIDILRQANGKKFLVLGDMAELGDDAPNWHRQIGEAALQAQIDYVYAYGSLMRHAALSFGQQGYFFETQEALVAQLRGALTRDATVLVKGSNSMKMWQISQALLGE